MKYLLPLFLFSTLCLTSCADPNDDHVALRTVPTTNNPHLVPAAGKNRIPGIGSVR